MIPMEDIMTASWGHDDCSPNIRKRMLTKYQKDIMIFVRGCHEHIGGMFSKLEGYHE